MRRTLLSLIFLTGIYSYSFGAAKGDGDDGADASNYTAVAAAAVAPVVDDISFPQNNDEAVTSVIFYPNPVKDILTVRFPKKGTYTVLIYNIIGDKVMEKTVSDDTEVRMDMSEMQNGMFFLSYEFDGKVVTKRFSKSN